MAKSLFSKFKGLMSRQKKSEISGKEAETAGSANLSRIGLTTVPAGADLPEGLGQTAQQASDPSVSLNLSGTEGPAPAEHSEPVGIQFYAELPIQASAEEIVNVSKRADNCVDATLEATGEDSWRVSLVLKMLPVPQQIHEVENMLDIWSQKLGGKSNGWGLAQA